MSELMEHRLDIVDGEKSRLCLGRGRHVPDIDDDRTDILSVFPLVLLPESVHPSATPLGGTRVIVCHEYSKKTAVGIRDLEGLDRGIVHRHTLKRFDVNAIDLVSRGEDPMADILHLEIWLGLVLVKSKLASSDLLGVVEPVPRLDLGSFGKITCSDVLVHNLLHVNHFLLCLGISGRLDRGQELINRGRISGHLVIKDISGEGVEAKHPGLLSPEFQDLKGKGLVVVFIAIITSG